MTDGQQFAEEVKKFAKEAIRQSLLDSSKVTPVSPLEGERVKDSEQDRDLKKKYAHRFMWILVGQLIVMNIIFVLVGAGKLRFDIWTLNLYTGGAHWQKFLALL